MPIQGGGYILILKHSQYDILVNIGAFRGIKVTYDIDPRGNYQIKLNSADWSTFQVNLGATGSVPRGNHKQSTKNVEPSSELNSD